MEQDVYDRPIELCFSEDLGPLKTTRLSVYFSKMQQILPAKVILSGIVLAMFLSRQLRVKRFVSISMALCQLLTITSVCV